MTDEVNYGKHGLLSLRAVSKRYDERDVLDHIDLDIAQGEFVVFVGRSGSGKSTLLNILGGLDEVSSGSVYYDGCELGMMTETQRSAFRRRSLGFVFQFFNLIPTLTVAENLSLPLALNSVTNRAMRLRTIAMLEELKLLDCAARFPDQLSGGEQQRVAIARALIHEPSMILADEPTGNLDLDTAAEVLALLSLGCRQRGTTLVIATHSNEVSNMADRAITIKNGRLETAQR